MSSSFENSQQLPVVHLRASLTLTRIDTALLMSFVRRSRRVNIVVVLVIIAMQMTAVLILRAQRAVKTTAFVNATDVHNNSNRTECELKPQNSRSSQKKRRKVD